MSDGVSPVTIRLGFFGSEVLAQEFTPALTAQAPVVFAFSPTPECLGDLALQPLWRVDLWQPFATLLSLLTEHHTFLRDHALFHGQGPSLPAGFAWLARSCHALTWDRPLADVYISGRLPFHAWLLAPSRRTSTPEPAHPLWDQVQVWEQALPAALVSSFPRVFEGDLGSERALATLTAGERDCPRLELAQMGAPSLEELRSWGLSFDGDDRALPGEEILHAVSRASVATSERNRALAWFFADFFLRSGASKLTEAPLPRTAEPPPLYVRIDTQDEPLLRIVVRALRARTTMREGSIHWILCGANRQAPELAAFLDTVASSANQAPGSWEFTSQSVDAGRTGQLQVVALGPNHWTLSSSDAPPSFARSEFFVFSDTCLLDHPQLCPDASAQRWGRLVGATPLVRGQQLPLTGLQRLIQGISIALATFTASSSLLPKQLVQQARKYLGPVLLAPCTWDQSGLGPLLTPWSRSAGGMIHWAERHYRPRCDVPPSPMFLDLAAFVKASVEAHYFAYNTSANHFEQQANLELLLPLFVRNHRTIRSGLPRLPQRAEQCRYVIRSAIASLD